ncbi:hypothetical protein HD597_012853 [Nonomuraea thailandensis]|uniref:Uncharacterized protein n=1 Tax=Nonomuraea thailandensis TaxID=1188745 RepID=A0A9X2GY26_9ACTN|nr:hypothetical protein [Nonomuraea thailandensis]MCP2365749.1 hypothetical protein [Nonomuraea thailandensis]
MEKIRITQPDWDLADWGPADLTVEGVVMALEGCGDNESPMAVVDAYGRELRIVGVRRQGSRVEIVVSAEGAG